MNPVVVGVEPLASACRDEIMVAIETFDMWKGGVKLLLLIIALTNTLSTIKVTPSTEPLTCLTVRSTTLDERIGEMG